jgi:GNAT superfamily N-acetyltransferase
VVTGSKSQSDSTSFPPVRRLDPADLKQCVALSVDRGWLPEKAKWSLLLAASEPFGVDAPDGAGLAGAVVLTRWGPDLASVGMMLVAVRYGCRGLGRALMEHLIAEAGDSTITLFATDLGRPLYGKLGFRPVRRNVSFAGTFRPSNFQDNSKRPSASGWHPRSATVAGPAGVTRPATEADLPAILAVDAAAFGADRSHILRRLPGFAERIAVLDGRADLGAAGIAGYAAAWRNGPVTTVIGPVVGPDASAATLLIADLAGQGAGKVRLDLDPDRPELPGWAYAHGLEPVARTTVMVLGDSAPRGTPDCLFAPISVALA